MGLRRWSIVLAALLALVGAGVAAPAQADETLNGPIFTAMNTSETLPDGIWFRNSPHTADTDRVTGHGPYMGERLQLRCYAWGDSVGPYNDTLWYKALDVSRPTNAGVENSGFINAHYVDDGQNANVIDAGVPDCSAASAAPTVGLAQGPAAPAGYRYAITLDHFAGGSSVSVTCYDSASPGGFYTFSLSTDGSGHAFTQSYCYSGDGPDHWVLAGGVESNHVSWGTGSSGGGGSTGGGSGSGTDTFINGIDVGQPMNDRHSWGPCDVQDFDGGPSGRLIVSFTNGTYIVKAGMLWGWFDYGGAPGFGCPSTNEVNYANGVRQEFGGGRLYWVNGMNHAAKAFWSDTTSNLWAGYAVKMPGLTTVSGVWKVPAVTCSASGASYESMWVGIDGEHIRDLVQAGSGSNCSKQGATPHTYVWWEKIPDSANSHELTGVSVKPGDQVGASITYTGKSFTIYISVNGRAQQPITGTLQGVHGSAECVVESPQVNGGNSQLAKFGTATFDRCIAASTTSNGTFPLLDGPSHGGSLLRIDNRVSALKSTPTLPVTNSTFSVLWRHA